MKRTAKNGIRKKLISILLLVALVMSLTPIGTIVSATATVDKSSLSAEIESAKPLIYMGKTEQSRKYLADRIERAEAVYYNELATEQEVTAATTAVQNAVESLADMYAFELLPLDGFTEWSDGDLEACADSLSDLSLGEVNTPEGAQKSVKVKGAVFSNSESQTVVGPALFGKAIEKADGFKLWLSVSEPAAFDISVGVKGAETHTFTLHDVNVRNNGYVYLPFDRFVSEEENAVIPKDESLNYLCIKKTGWSTVGFSFEIADFNAYDEILEGSKKTQYSEEKIMSRGQLENNAYYKIIETVSGKAITFGPETTETALAWERCVDMVDGRMEFSLEENREGDRTQMWQFAPSPAGDGSFRIINKSCSNALCRKDFGDGSVVEAAAVKLGGDKSELQLWQVTMVGGKTTIRMRENGYTNYLTTAGNQIKVTKSKTYKKFFLYKVTETEYVQSWSDEFDGDKLDRSKWVVDDGFYFGGSVTTMHVDNEGETLKLEDGMMNLITKPGRYGAWEMNGTYMSTSGKFALSYGKVEIRAKLAYGNGQFPALWMMPTDMMNMGGGEIDIMEMVVTNDIRTNGQQIGTIHWTSDDGRDHWSKVNYMPIYGYGEKYLSDDFHTYGVEMDHNQVRYYFDGIQYMSLVINTEGKRFAFGDMPKYIIINNSTKGDDLNFINHSWGVEDEYKTQIDYVRCYLEAGDMTDNVPDFTTPDSINYSQGINAVPTSDFWDINHPVDIKSDGTEGAVVDHYNRLYIFDPRTRETKKVVDYTDVSNSTTHRGDPKLQRTMRARYSPDGSKLAVANNQGCILIYNTATYNPNTAVLIKNGAVIQENVLFTNDGTRLVVGGFSSGSQAYANPMNSSNVKKWCFRVFDTSDGALVNEVYVGSDPRYIALSDDGTKLVVTTTSNGTYVYNTADLQNSAPAIQLGAGSESELAETADIKPLHGSAFTPDPAVPEAQRPYLPSLTGHHDGAILGADFSSDGKLLLTSDDKGVINVWDSENLTFLRSMNNVNTGSVRRAFFSPDDRQILATSAYGAARLFDVGTGEPVSLLGGFGNVIREVAYSPDGKYIVAASYDGGIKLFAANGTYLETLQAGETDENMDGYIISRIKFSPDSRYVYASTRTLPAALQRWQLPYVVDKTALKDKLAQTSSGTPEYDYAKKVSGLKYATPEMVAKAYRKINPDFLPGGAIVIASDKYDNVSSGEYIVLTINAPADLSGAYVTIGDRNFALTPDVIIGEEYDIPSYTCELKVRVHIPEDLAGGEYEVKFFEPETNFSGTCQKNINVRADSVVYPDDFLYEVSGDAVHILAGISGKRNIVIPDKIEGHYVTEIASYAFSKQGRTVAHMTVKLPTHLKTIKKCAFKGCTSLRAIEFPEGLEKIEQNAFDDCRQLSDIRVPSGTCVDTYAFRSAGVGTVKLATEANVIKNAFSDTLRIREIIVEEGSTHFKAILGKQVLMERVYIPESVHETYADSSGEKPSINDSNANNLFTSNRNKVKLLGVPGSYAQTYAEKYPDTYNFVPLAAPIITGVAEGETYNTFDNVVAAKWDEGHVAYLNGEKYALGTPITTPGSYTLKVINGYDEYSTEIHFEVIYKPPYVIGDLDSDKKVTVADALIALKISIGLLDPVENQAVVGDVDVDGAITVSDALRIMRTAAGIKTKQL